jgi:Asp-tRNA(Asn)/Glu-tRNA(Gln) amidotransferase A subunit family amidase
MFGNGGGANPDAVSFYGFAFQFGQYLELRGDQRVFDWKTLNANAKYMNDVRTVAMKNWENKQIDIATPNLVNDMKRQYVMRMVALKVLKQNDIDVFVNPPLLALPARIGQISAGGGGGGGAAGHGYGASLGIPEVFVPAGFSSEIYEPTFKLKADGTGYESTPGTKPTKVAGGLPFNMAFWAGPGDEAVLLTVASAYEAATKHRKAPAGFGPVRTGLLSSR